MNRDDRSRSRSKDRDRKRRKRSRSRSLEASHSRSRDRRHSPEVRNRRNPSRERSQRSRSFDKRRKDRSSSRDNHKKDRNVKNEPSSPKSYRKPKDNQNWGKPELYIKKEEKVIEKEKPSFETSGKLAVDTNTFKGVVIKYNEPPEAKLPKLRWRLYPFKGEESMPAIYIHRQSAYLVGRDRKIADFPVDHPSCSKQHAALQYRSVTYERADGSKGRRTKPYVIDLSSANGTYLNGERIDSQRYYEIKEKDVLKFGFSSREYVVLHENSLNKVEEKASDSSDDEDESDEDEEPTLNDIKKETEKSEL